MFVMKKNMDMKMIEKLHDCFILDFNPYEQKSCSFKKYDGVYITAEKGQVILINTKNYFNLILVKESQLKSCCC